MLPVAPNNPVKLLPFCSAIGAILKAAVTFLAAFMFMTQDPVPEQSPPQPAKLLPVSAVACRVTEEFVVNNATQLLPQLIPAGTVLTSPVPAPDLLTVRVWVLLGVAALDAEDHGPVPTVLTVLA